MRNMHLMTWFKEYVYIPMGGNRLGKKRTVVNLFIVLFFFTISKKVKKIIKEKNT